MNLSRPDRLPGPPPRRTARPRHVWETVCLALALTPCFGCGRDSLPATVEGTVRLDGKPLKNCLVTFMPEPGQQAEAGGRRFTGLTDRHGCYRLRCDSQQEGAATGWYRVTVEDLSVSTGVRRRDHGTVDLEMEETAPPARVRRSRVAPRYSSPKDTPLRKEVKPGHQVIDLEIR